MNLIFDLNEFFNHNCQHAKQYLKSIKQYSSKKLVFVIYGILNVV